DSAGSIMPNPARIIGTIIGGSSKRVPSAMDTGVLQSKCSTGRFREASYTNIPPKSARRSEEHTSELQSRFDLVCRHLLEKKNEKRFVQVKGHRSLRGKESVLQRAEGAGGSKKTARTSGRPETRVAKCSLAHVRTASWNTE